MPSDFYCERRPQTMCKLQVVLDTGGSVHFVRGDDSAPRLPHPVNFAGTVPDIVDREWLVIKRPILASRVPLCNRRKWNHVLRRVFSRSGSLNTARKADRGKASSVLLEGSFPRP